MGTAGHGHGQVRLPDSKDADFTDLGCMVLSLDPTGPRTLEWLVVKGLVLPRAVAFSLGIQSAGPPATL